MIGVSFVVPVFNGESRIRATLESIFAQADGRPMEVIVVDDRSRDRSSEIIRRLAAVWPLRVIDGEGRGAAAAINAGIRAARHPIICQVDQDVVLGPGWMQRLTAALDDDRVAAAQGYYATDRESTLFARAMGYDLEQRYAAIERRWTDHVCTGNSAYRADALRRVGLFDEALGYGYDNDISYRLREAGYRLAFCREATSTHRWREGLRGFCVQQYGFGYGRIDLVAKHPHRAGGDSVSPAAMMAHPVLAALSALGLVAAALVKLSGGPAIAVAWASAGLLIALMLERLAAGFRAAWRFRALTPLLFPLLHLVRDFAWVAAIAMWCTRRLARRTSTPAHSMRPHLTTVIDRVLRPSRLATFESRPPRATRIACVVPAHNEAKSLSAVIHDVRAVRPGLDVLVVDDGSEDETASVAADLGVRWLRLRERLGVGSAMRAGLRYAALLGYDAAVRIDADGQHRAADISRVIDPILRGDADVVLGSRYGARGSEMLSEPPPSRSALRRASRASSSEPRMVRATQRMLARCLSTLTSNAVTDPTSGFCAVGPRAIKLLAEHHPTGYPEAELRLFLKRNGLTVLEVPISGRPRLHGRTSLTPVRLIAAGARVLLAMCIVPLRGRVRGLVDD